MCRANGRPVHAALADYGRNEGRRRLRLTGGQQHSEGKFVPGENQAEDGRGGNAGGGLRQHHLEEGMQPRVAVNHGRLFIFLWNFINETFQQPHGQRNIDGGVKQNHAKRCVGEANLAVHEIDRNGHSDGRHHAGGEDKEQEIIGERYLEAREGISRKHPKGDSQKS